MLIPILIGLGVLVLSKKNVPVQKALIAAPASKPVPVSAAPFYQSQNSHSQEPATKQSIGFVDRQVIEDMHNHTAIKGILTNRLDTIKNNGNNYNSTILSSISDENDNSFDVAAVPNNADVNNRPLLSHSFHLYAPLDSSDTLHAPVYHDAAASIAPLPPKQDGFHKVLAIIASRVSKAAIMPTKSVTNPNAQLTKFNSLRELYGRN